MANVLNIRLPLWTQADSMNLQYFKVHSQPTQSLNVRYAPVPLRQEISLVAYSDCKLAFCFSRIDAQQQVPTNARIANSAPKTVKAILAQETCHQAKTITKIANTNLHQHLDILVSF
jgi:hypothetical protein